MYGLLVSNNFILQFLREEYVLDEDDYELLEYNNVIPRRKVEDIYLIVVSAALNWNPTTFVSIAFLFTEDFVPG